ncbi:hypothetical protein HN51_049002 [Arachis hypogaea]
MENHQTLSEKFEKFTWTINNNFYELEYYEDHFVVGGYTWLLVVAVDEDRLMDICLKVVDYSPDLIQGHSVTANFKLSLVNQRVDTLTKSIDGQVRFNGDADDADYVFSWRMSLAPLLQLTLDDNCFIVAEFFLKESPRHHNELDDGTSNTIIDDSSKPCFHVYEDLDNTNEKGFVQLVEEACHKHPSLIECHKNKNHSSIFTKWGFMAMWRVLHFLKTKKVKDMNVKLARNYRNYKERAMHVKKMKENVAALEVDLKVAREELVKAQQGFEERDLNDVLGY